MPFRDVVFDFENSIYLTSLPEAEAIDRLRKQLGFLSSQCKS
jgi:hypothetical protein